ncbi:MAG: hypothetical protein J0L69_01100 [Bacteroidetes bacterium]|nr:hypothetical protein [Bacteroidota bacterium]
MKRLLILLAFFVVKLNAQDTIRFKNGITKAVKVSEIGLTEVRYNDFSNPTGPIYVVNKNDISSIRYSNGVEDKFNNVAPSTSTNPAPVATKSLNDRIDIKRGDLFYNGKRVGEVRLQKLVNNCPDAEKQNRMVPVMQEMKKYKKNQYLFGFLGLGLGLMSLPVGIIATGISEDATPFFICLGAGATIAITGQVISGINKGKRNAKKLEVAKIYNGEL